jgi:hypothetical protein
VLCLADLLYFDLEIVVHFLSNLRVDGFDARNLPVDHVHDAVCVVLEGRVVRHHDARDRLLTVQVQQQTQDDCTVHGVEITYTQRTKRAREKASEIEAPDSEENRRRVQQRDEH